MGAEEEISESLIFWSRLKRPCFGRFDGSGFAVSIFLVEQSDKANS